ncbi:pyridoxamine 5'-phosphate oxidase family protein [Patescibacteria group bacterium]
MIKKEYLELAKKIIKDIKYIDLATVTPKGQPWNTPVYTAYDKKYTFYWASDKENVHSKNIKDNNKVFGVIYDSTAKEGTGFGVYLKGKAYEVTNIREMAKAAKLLYSRAGDKPAAIQEFMKRFPRRLYKFLPEKVWINDDGKKNDNFVDIRIEIPLLNN